MPVADFDSYKVASQEVSSSTKFNNFVEAAEGAVNSIDNDKVSGSAAIAVSKLAAAAANGQILKTVSGSPAWAEVLFPPTHIQTVPGTGTMTATANRALLMPLPAVAVAFTLTRIVFSIVTSSGNMDIGVYYSDDEATFTRHFSSGSFATPAAGSNIRTFATQTITPASGRRWYLGLAFDNATVQFVGGTALSAGGYYKDSSFALPASLTSMTSGAGVGMPAAQLMV